LINEKQKALSDLQNALSDKCGNVGVDVGGTLFAGVAVGLIALVYANRAEISSWPFSIGVVLTTQVLGGGFLFGAGFVGGGVLCSMSTQKQLDAANANLQVSKDHLQVLVNAYNTK
jgi:hypothetical protein